MMHRLRFPFVLLLALLVSAFSIGQQITAEAKTEVLLGVEEILKERAFVPGQDLNRWNDFIAKQRDEINKADTQPQFVNAVNRALREFGFSHIRLRTPAAREARGRTTTVGVGFSARLDAGTLVITNVFPESPAALAGLKPGDVVVEVDGKAPDSPAVLTGEDGTELAVKVRTAEGDMKELTLKRQQFSTVRRETLTWLDDETAVLRVFTFSRGYGRDNIENLMKDAAKAKYLILDLRSNGGGAVNNLQHLLSLLLPNDTVIGTFISSADARRYVEENGSEASDPIAIAHWSNRKYRTVRRPVAPFTGRIAVLTNRGSASASEICAAALQENVGAVVVGQRTAGAVLASVFGRLPHGFEMQYPVQDFVTAKGVRLEGNPVRPDAEVSARPEEGKDPAIEKALELMRKK
jgi:carboxyl-terminal processing protease